MVTPFGTTPDGDRVERVEIANGGTRAAVITWGASLQQLNLGDGPSICLGSPNFDAYLGPLRYFGAIVGPIANRIAGGRLPMGGQQVQLECNERGINMLHGGTQGFGQRNWTIIDTAPTYVTMRIDHPNGLGGFVGNISSTVTYALDDLGALSITIIGSADHDIFFGPAFHGYWNLSGSSDLRDHLLEIPAQSYLPVDENKIPLGAPLPVSGDFDYRAPRAIAPILDHNFCLRTARDGLVPMCRLTAGGIAMDVSSTEVGLQIYAGARMNSGDFIGHGGAPYGPCGGIAIEPQYWPDTPNHPDYPSSWMPSATQYKQLSRFSFTRLS